MNNTKESGGGVNTLSNAIVQIHPNNDDFVENVKRWVVLDTHLKMVNERTKQFREERRDLAQSICDHLEKHNMQNKRIGIHDGDLRISDKKEYTPLSFGYLEERLGEIIPESSSVEFIIQYLKEKRTVKISSELKRTYRTADEIAKPNR